MCLKSSANRPESVSSSDGLRVSASTVPRSQASPIEESLPRKTFPSGSQESYERPAASDAPSRFRSTPQERKFFIGLVLQPVRDHELGELPDRRPGPLDIRWGGLGRRN